MLSAAAQVDYLDYGSWLQISLKHGVWRSLVVRGLLRPHRGGWQTTERGQEVIDNGRFVITSKHQQKEGRLMNGKLPRYRVSRTIGGWAVIDRSLPETKAHANVVAREHSRTAARNKARELNLHELQEKNATGDAA